MSRLIDADALLDIIKIQMLDEDYDITCVISDIENAPTIDLIHCSDCRFRYGSSCTRFAEIPITLNDYCSRGKKK